MNLKKKLEEKTPIKFNTDGVFDVTEYAPGKKPKKSKEVIPDVFYTHIEVFNKDLLKAVLPLLKKISESKEFDDWIYHEGCPKSVLVDFLEKLVEEKTK